MRVCVSEGVRVCARVCVSEGAWDMRSRLRQGEGVCGTVGEMCISEEVQAVMDAGRGGRGCLTSSEST